MVLVHGHCTSFKKSGCSYSYFGRSFPVTGNFVGTNILKSSLLSKHDGFDDLFLEWIAKQVLKYLVNLTR